MLLHEMTFTPERRRPQIRAEEGVIAGVRVLGRESKNGRIYTERALEQAAELYEGCEVNIDHPGDASRSGAIKQRGLAEGFGELRNVALCDDGVYADLHYLKSHPMAAQIVERAQRFPSKVGLSHNAEGIVRSRRGRAVVEGIRRVISVDVVARPATNHSLFESEDESMTRRTVRQIFERLFPSRAKQFLREMSAAAAPAAEQAIEIPTAASDDDELKAACRGMVLAIFEDETLDAQATLRALGEIVRSQEQLIQSADEDGDSFTSSELAEGVAGSRRQPSRDTRAECRALLESLDLEVSDTRLAALGAVPRDQRGELLRAWQAGADKRRGARPATSVPLYEELGRGPIGSLPDWKDSGAFVSAITR